MTNNLTRMNIDQTLDGITCVKEGRIEKNYLHSYTKTFAKITGHFIL